MAGRVLLIAAWVIFVGGLAGGAAYLHSLGPVPGPPDLSLPEPAPAVEAPPRLDAPPEAPAGPDGAQPELQAGQPDQPPAAASEPPRLLSLGEAAEAAGTTVLPPAVEALDALGGGTAGPMAPVGEGLPELEALAATGQTGSERFEPQTAWPVNRPELHGPMPMAERPTIDLALLAGNGAATEPEQPEAAPEEPAGSPEHPPAGEEPEAAPAVETSSPAALTAPEPERRPVDEPEIADAPAPLEDARPETVAPPEAAPETPPAEPVAEVPALAEEAAPPTPVPPEAPVRQEPAGEAVAMVTPPPVIEAPRQEPPAATVAEDQPVVAVVVVGLGLSSGATEAAIQSLPAAVTLSFSPYSNRLQDWVALARAAGHEVLIDLPMEPADFPHSDPGPQALMTGLPPDVNLQRLDWVLSRADNYVGVGSFMGSRFAADAAAMRPVLREIAARGLIYLDNGQAVGNVVRTLGAELGVPLLVSDLQVDSMAARHAIDAELSRVEALALEDGEALAIGTAYPVTIERLAVWTRGLAARGIRLAPASALVGR